jgi:hypothetical protein
VNPHIEPQGDGSKDPFKGVAAFAFFLVVIVILALAAVK